MWEFTKRFLVLYLGIIVIFSTGRAYQSTIEEENRNQINVEIENQEELKDALKDSTLKIKVINNENGEDEND